MWKLRTLHCMGTSLNENRGLVQIVCCSNKEVYNKSIFFQMKTQVDLPLEIPVQGRRPPPELSCKYPFNGKASP